MDPSGHYPEPFGEALSHKAARVAMARYDRLRSEGASPLDAGARGH